MKCKNKEIYVLGFVYAEGEGAKPKVLRCVCSNDERGKTLTVGNGSVQFSVPMEELEPIFRGDYRKKG